MKTELKVFCKSPWGMSFTGYFIAMGLVGALTPPSILTVYSWIRPFTDLMASLVSQIDKVTALGIDADINRFYFSVMWAGAPFLVLIYALAIKIDKRRKIDNLSYYRKDKPKAFKEIIIIFILGLVTYQIEWFVDVSLRIAIGGFGTNFGRFFAPQIFVLGPVFCSLPLITFLAMELTDGIKRKIRA
jgi:hypothetical protein